MKIFVGIAAVALAATQAAAQAPNSKYKCTPFNVLMTRAVGTPASLQTDPATGQKVWGPAFDLDNVNLQSVGASFKFIISECIDFATGIDQVACTRKNQVNYLDFYEFTICQPNNASWWFSSMRPDGYGNQSAISNYGFGKFLAFDGGYCNGDAYCNYIFGSSNIPALGSWIGWQDESNDARNPTPNAAWYSAPGSCPMRGWGQIGTIPPKDAACQAAYPSGRCAPGVTPDGITCTYQYQFLGEIDVSQLVGIYSMKDKNGNNYKDYTSYCREYSDPTLKVQKEFVRDPNDFHVISSLPFWANATNPQANLNRIQLLLEHYADNTLYPNNKPLPTTAAINAQNPQPGCVNSDCAKNGASCYWNDNNLPQACSSGGSSCTTYSASQCKGPWTDLAQVPIPVPSSNNGGGSTGGNGGNGGGGGGGGNSGNTNGGGGTGGSPSPKGSSAATSYISGVAAVAGVVAGIFML